MDHGVSEGTVYVYCKYTSKCRTYSGYWINKSCGNQRASLKRLHLLGQSWYGNQEIPFWTKLKFAHNKSHPEF